MPLATCLLNGEYILAREEKPALFLLLNLKNTIYRLLRR